jgi:viologen exporter family transport system permease protein
VSLPPSLRTDLEYAKRGYRRYAAYPAATAAGLFTNTVFGFMRTFVLLALFADRADVAGYDRAAAVTYTWLTQGLIATIFIWGWQDLSLRIRTGDIATDLIRPIHPLRAGLAFDLGRSVYHAAFRGVPPILVGALFFTLILPADVLAWSAFALSVALAVTVSYGFRALYNLFSFWLLDHRGTTLLAIGASNLFSGFILPIRFFPPWLEAVARVTPFPSMVQTPVDIFIGRTAGPDVVVALATQLAWAIALVLASRGVFALGVRRLVVQGG